MNVSLFCIELKGKVRDRLAIGGPAGVDAWNPLALCDRWSLEACVLWEWPRYTGDPIITREDAERRQTN